MKCKKLLSTILATAITISTFAAMPITASAETTKKTMNMGGSVIAKDDNIYYGNQTKWRVLSTEGNTTKNGDTTEVAVYYADGSQKPTIPSEGPLFVISENDFGKRAFNSNNTQNWQGSEAQAWCNGDFYTAAGITAAEKAAILTTSKSDAAYQSYKATNNILNDKVFYLSAKEADTYLTDKTFIPDGGATVDWWWLRSPAADNSDVVMCDGTGNFYDAFAYWSDKVASRPAFNLNRESVLFTSAAGFTGGEVDNYSGNEWKFTLKSNNYDGFKINRVTRDENIVTLTYFNARTGDNEKISYIITDEDQKEIKYYGSQDVTSDYGSVNITLPDMDSGDKLFVFNEQVNGGYKTNYASELIEIAIPMLTVNVNESTMGTVVTPPINPRPGEGVQLMVYPNQGYKLAGFASDDGTLVVYSDSMHMGMFKMPDHYITVTANFEAITPESITVKDNEVYYLFGEEKAATTVFVENGGKIEDLSGGKGLLKIAKEDLYGRNYTDQFPLYDAENGGWRFFDCEVGAGYIKGDSSIIGTTLKFKDAETEAIAKRILASDNSGVSLDITLSETDENGAIHKVVCEAPQSVIKNYASDLTKPILMGVSGLKPGMTISVNYRFANGLVISKEVSNASPYIILEAGADKNYTVKVYGTALDGVVVVALYNSENEQKLIDVKVQKVAEISGQLQGNGEFVKAMWWSDLDVMTPLCDAAGKDLTITTP